MSVNVRGKSGDAARGAWCTPAWLAKAVGSWDLDPFCNERSHVVTAASCCLERGDDGLDAARGPGAYRTRGEQHVASPGTRVWGQPDYAMVRAAFRHYAHTRWCFLLRFDPSTQWFAEIYDAAAFVAVPRGRRVNFEPPPGVKASSNPYPHALFFKDADLVTDEVLRLCIAWKKKPR